MKNTIKLLVAVLSIAAFACTPPSNQSSNEKKEPHDSTQLQTPPDSSNVRELNDSSISK